MKILEMAPIAKCLGKYNTQTTLNQYDANLKKKDIIYYNLSINLAKKYPKQLFFK